MRVRPSMSLRTLAVVLSWSPVCSCSGSATNAPVVASFDNVTVPDKG